MLLEKIKIGNVCRVKNGYAFQSDSFKEEGVPIIRISDIEQGEVKIKKTMKVDEKPIYEEFEINKDDILIAMSGATTGKYGIFKSDIKAYQNQRVGCFKIKDKSKLDNYFLYHLLNKIKNKIEKDAYGGGQPNISSKMIESYEIVLPPLEDQIHIASLLSRIEELIAKRKESIRMLDEFVKSTFLEMFGDPVRNEKGWDRTLLGNVSISRLGKMRDEKHITGNFLKKYLGNSNVKWFLFDFNNLLEMDFNEKEQKEFSLEKDDLLICEGGEIGRCAIWKDEIKNCYFQKALHRVRVDKNKLNVLFLAYLMLFYSLNDGFKGFSSESTIAHLTGEKLKKLPIPLPPIAQQGKFASIVQKIESIKIKYQESLSELEKLYGAVSQRAFRGEL